MTRNKYPILPAFAETTMLNTQQYDEMYAASIEDPEKFWGEMATKHLDWFKQWDKVCNSNFEDPKISWFEGAKINASYNCLDRHLQAIGEQAAIIWEPDDPDAAAVEISYIELHAQVCRLASALDSLGVSKGDRVCIYMPMIPEAAVAMLACARVGAIHSVVFGGFSAEALAGRIEDAGAKLVITADEGRRGGKHVPLKKTVDKALSIEAHNTNSVKKVVVVKHTGGSVGWREGRDVWYHDATAGYNSNFPAAEMDANDPLFILYTSGSTGKPKGVVHGTGGYLLHAAVSHRYVFDYKEHELNQFAGKAPIGACRYRRPEVYWCTADIGWITGHSYGIYGPLANGATTVMFEGTPNYPTWSRFWEVVDRHDVSIVYTAPTAVRAIQAQGDEWVNRTKRTSLKLLGSVGEPISPETWEWFYHVVGDGRCPIVDTWWQTETGGIMMTPMPGAHEAKPGKVMKPFFGIKPVLLDKHGEEIEGEGAGDLCFKNSWPGQMITVFGNHERFKLNYFTHYNGYYASGDGASRDEDGDIKITGRTDDVINVSGHRLSTAEIEAAIVKHHAVSEAAVVACPHDIKGQCIYAYVTVLKEFEDEIGDHVKEEITKQLNVEIGPIAKPEVVQWAKGLPKTRSGKIMRRILRKIAEDPTQELGDTSTLAEPQVVEDLIADRKEINI